MLTQMVRLKGGETFAVVGTEAKREVAKGGADHVIVSGDGDLADQVEAVAGKRQMAVDDGVGAATFETSLRLLRRRGMLVAFGNASGPVPPIDVLTLSRNGSLFLTRPSLGDYIVERRPGAARRGPIRLDRLRGSLLSPSAPLPLAEAAEAHRALEGRQTTGKVLLIPGREY